MQFYLIIYNIYLYDTCLYTIYKPLFAFIVLNYMFISGLSNTWIVQTEKGSKTKQSIII